MRLKLILAGKWPLMDMRALMTASKRTPYQLTNCGDFTLVTTYLPIMVLTFRGTALISIMYWWMYTCRLSLMLSSSDRYLLMSPHIISPP